MAETNKNMQMLHPTSHSLNHHLSQSSAPTDLVEEESARLLGEADSYLRLALVDKAAEHLAKGLQVNPALRALREPLIKLFVIQHKYQQAITELWTLVSLCKSPQEEVRFLRYILRLGEPEPVAQRRLKEIFDQLHGQLPSPAGVGVGPQLSLTSIDQELRQYLGRHRPSTDLTQTQVIAHEPNHLNEGANSPSAVTIPNDPEALASAEALAANNAMFSDEPPAAEHAISAPADLLAHHSQISPPPSAHHAHSEVSADEPAHAFRVGLNMRRFGLHERALAMFEKAREDEHLRVRATLLIALCYRDLNRTEEAITRLMHGVNLPEASESELIELFYELGKSYELIANVGEAILFYQLALGASGEFRDAAARITSLQNFHFTT